MLWHIISHRGRGGQTVYFSLGLPSDGRPFANERDPARTAEIQRRLDESGRRIASEAARILGLNEASVVVHERPIENCCGVGCQSCLLTKPAHAERWTGLPPRPLVKR